MSKIFSDAWRAEKLHEQIGLNTELRRENARLRELLKPLAEAYRNMNGKMKQIEPFLIDSMEVTVKVTDAKRAHEALAAAEENQG